jgi:hypothetical protein
MPVLAAMNVWNGEQPKHGSYISLELYSTIPPVEMRPGRAMPPKRYVRVLYNDKVQYLPECESERV